MGEIVLVEPRDGSLPYVEDEIVSVEGLNAGVSNGIFELDTVNPDPSLSAEYTTYRVTGDFRNFAKSVGEFISKSVIHRDRPGEYVATRVSKAIRRRWLHACKHHSLTGDCPRFGISVKDGSGGNNWNIEVFWNF